VIGAPSIFRVIRKAAALARVLPTFAFRVAENAARRKCTGLAQFFFFFFFLFSFTFFHSFCHPTWEEGEECCGSKKREKRDIRESKSIREVAFSNDGG
jgi:hypothetical protein